MNKYIMLFNNMLPSELKQFLTPTFLSIVNLYTIFTVHLSCKR